MRLVVIGILLLIALPSLGMQNPPPPYEGVLPVGKDGKPLNLDFETGTLKDWTAEGDAFKNQPIKGDTVSPRRNDMKSQHQGQYWIGSYERFGDKPRGTLTSVPFKVTHPWGTFLVGGGPWPETCVELVVKQTGKVFFRVSGIEEENLRRVAVDLKPFLGKEILIRLVDRHSGHWGHINFDDFRFHKEKPKVPPRPAFQVPPPPDVYPFAGLPPEKAAKAMTVPKDFEVKLFAGEPNVHQPIAFCIDDRGRLWVAEAYCYPQRRPHKGPLLPRGEKGDRIVIFEDSDGDGAFDKRTVFLEGLNLVSGLEVGFGGVWIGAAPYLLFVPIQEGQDRPAGPPRILLDGWGWHDTHETLNAFTWGPDGWLYGCHGVFTHSRVGKPGTPDNKRIPLNASIWRYHPVRHVFEVFAHGTSNPWGLDFNDMGQAFCEACVIPHAFHLIQEGRYQRQAGSHFNPHTYADIQTIADHLHWTGANPWAGNNRSDTFGGGHAHCGLMIYLGGTWPAKYRNQMFMGNIHGRRINMDILKTRGSGYVASHGPDFLLANDAWARFINLRYGPDGNVYLIDWYDKQACHLPNPTIWDRSNGRIYKICHRGSPKLNLPLDLQKCSDAELAAHQLSDNEWHARHARRILQERFGDKEKRQGRMQEFWKLRTWLSKEALKNPEPGRRLRALWTMHVIGALEPAVLSAILGDLLKDKNEFVRGWIVQLALENPDQAVSTSFPPRLVEMAKKDPSPVVRRYLASASFRLKGEGRWQLVENLLVHAEDAGDPNLPFLYWYAAEPLAEWDPARALDLAGRSKIPMILPFMVKRLASPGTAKTFTLVVDALNRAGEPSLQLIYLRALNEALKGRGRVDMPPRWKEIYPGLARSENADVRAQALALAVSFGDPTAMTELRAILMSTRAALSDRLNALNALRGARDPELAPLLLKLLNQPALRGPALLGLASFEHPGAPEAILKIFPSLTPGEKRDALNTLSARLSYGRALLNAIGSKKIRAAEVPAEIVRQLRNLHDPDLDKRIAQVWGIIRDTPADRARIIAGMRTMLTKPSPIRSDLALGRAMYVKTCAQCHTLFGAGGKIGPDLTGSNRANLDYILENILDPSAVIPKEYAVTVMELKDGRVITGIVKAETPAVLTVQTANEVLALPPRDIALRKASTTSMMPDDLLKPLNPEEIRALIAYLQSPMQTPLLATAENAKDFFNGKDLTNWEGDRRLWTVANGEIVGKSPGIKHNSFLQSHMLARDFRLSLKVKLTPDSGNSGIQFRSEPLPDGEMKGPQADIGKGWWGKLYEENGRGLLWKKSGELFVKPGQWNSYEIIAHGNRVRTFINGKLCVDMDDPLLNRRGIFALQIHAGEAMEVRFKDLKLEVEPGPTRSP